MGKFFNKLKDEPIIVYTAGPDGDIDYADEMGHQLIELLNQQTEKITYISNMLPVVHLDMDGLSKLAAVASWGDASPFRHRNIKKVVIATQNPTIAAAAQNFGTQIYGNIPVSVVESLEEALRIARS